MVVNKVNNAMFVEDVGGSLSIAMSKEDILYRLGKNVSISIEPESAFAKSNAVLESLTTR